MIFCEVSVVADSVNISGQSNAVQFKVREFLAHISNLLAHFFEFF